MNQNQLTIEGPLETAFREIESLKERVAELERFIQETPPQAHTNVNAMVYFTQKAIKCNNKDCGKFYMGSNGVMVCGAMPLCPHCKQSQWSWGQSK